MNPQAIRSFITAPLPKIDLWAKITLLAAIFLMPISTAATNIFMGLTLILWVSAGGYLSRIDSVRDNWFVIGTLIIFLGICLGGVYSTAEPNEILFQVYKYAKLLFVIPAISLLADNKWRERAMTAFSLSMLITLALSLLSVVWPLPFVRGTATGPSDSRWDHPKGHPATDPSHAGSPAAVSPSRL